MLIRQVHQQRELFVTIGIFLHKGLKFQLDVCMCFECHDVSRMFINLEDIAILKTYGDNH